MVCEQWNVTQTIYMNCVELGEESTLIALGKLEAAATAVSPPDGQEGHGTELCEM
jgi:hypothetical protein